MVDFIYSQSQSKLFDIPIYKYILHNTYIVTAVHSFLSLFQKKMAQSGKAYQIRHKMLACELIQLHKTKHTQNGNTNYLMVAQCK